MIQFNIICDNIMMPQPFEMEFSTFEFEQICLKFGMHYSIVKPDFSSFVLPATDRSKTFVLPFWCWHLERELLLTFQV